MGHNLNRYILLQNIRGLIPNPLRSVFAVESNALLIENRPSDEDTRSVGKVSELIFFAKI